MCYVCVPCYMRKSGKNHEVLRESARRLRKKVGPHRQFPARAKGRTASAVPRLALLLAPPSSSPSPFASPRHSRPRSAPPLPRRPSPPRSTRTSRRPALASLFASQIGPPPRPPTRAPPRAAVLLAASSPSPSRPSTPRSGQPRRRPSSVALGPKPTRRPLPAVVLLPPSCSSSLSSSRRRHPRAGSSPPPRPGQRPARTRRGAPRRPRFASTQPPPTKPALDSCPLLR